MNLGKIKKITKSFFDQTGFETKVEVETPKEEEDSINLPIKVKTDEPKPLIGKNGQNLKKIRHLLKILIRKNFTFDKRFYINLDINNYRENKIKYLKEKAVETANDVSLSRESKELSPMPADERRIIHIELSNRDDVETESVGREPERRVVIKPASED